MDVGLINFAIDAAIVIAIVGVLAVAVLFILLRPRPQQRLMLNLAQLQEGRRRTGIVAIRGTGGTIGLEIYARNRGNTLVGVQVEQGTLLEPSRPGWQPMVAARTEIFDLPPKTTQRYLLDAVSLDARSRPPSLGGESGYRVGGKADLDGLYALLDTVERLEGELARHVDKVEGDRIQLKPMSDELTILAASCTCSRHHHGVYDVRVSSEAIQYALWQVTDGLSLEQLMALVLRPYTHEGKVQLVLEVLAANVLLEAAGLKPTTGI